MDYEICYIGSVYGWQPSTSYRKFVVKESVGNNFIDVNNYVRKCCQDIEGIVASLKKLREKMGENTGTTSQMDKIVQGLEQKKEDLIKKNKEMIDACNQVLTYIANNKSSKSDECASIKSQIDMIDLYKG